MTTNLATRKEVLACANCSIAVATRTDMEDALLGEAIPTTPKQGQPNRAAPNTSGSATNNGVRALKASA